MSLAGGVSHRNLKAQANKPTGRRPIQVCRGQRVCVAAPGWMFRILSGGLRHRQWMCRPLA